MAFGTATGGSSLVGGFGTTQGPVGAGDDGGGGGGVFPTDGLIALFHNPDETYDSEGDTWDATNDSGLKMIPYTGAEVYAPTGVSNNRLTFSTTAGYYTVNAALAAALDDQQSLSIAMCTRMDAATQAYFNITGSGGQCYLGAYPSGGGVNRASGAFGGSNVQFADGTLIGGGQVLAFGSIASGGKVTSQVGGASEVESSGNVNAGNLGTVSGINALFILTGATSYSEVAFLAIYSKVLSAEEKAAIIAVVTDNALYGCAGFTP